MENSKDLYEQYNKQRLLGKEGPKVDMLKVMDNFKRSTDFFNNFGIKNNGPVKKPLTEANN